MSLSRVPSGLGTTEVSFKNRIINGAMMIDQRNAGASVTPNAGATYIVDRWQTAFAQNGKFTVQQNAGSVTPPAGFTNYLGATSTSAYSVGSADFFTFQQHVEGFNVADLGWGTANAQPITISFWVRSSLTGTFGGAVNNNGGTRSYPFTYTISSANTWEQKSITVLGDTSGTWLKNNALGLSLNFSMGMGSSISGTAGIWAGTGYYSATGATSVVGTNGATFYITGVQLEKGSTATSFDYRPYGTELALCQRYYEFESSGTNYRPLCWLQGSTPVTQSISVWFAVEKRANPTVTGTISIFVGGSTSGGTFGNITTRAFHAQQNGTAAAPALNGWSATAEL